MAKTNRPPLSPTPCPYLGSIGDPDTAFIQPHDSHRCQATDPAGPIGLADQLQFCFGASAACARFVPLVAGGRRAAPRVVDVDSVAVVAGPVAADDEAHHALARPASARPASARPEPARRRAAPEGWRDRFGRLSFEEWTVCGVTGAILVVIAYFTFLAGPAKPAAAVPSEGNRLQQTIIAIQASPTASGTPAPPATPRPTRAVDVGPPATVAIPTPAQGGLIAALSPSERGVGAFNDADRVPEFGERNLRVGRFDDRVYLGGMLFPLNKIPQGSRVTYVALELAGLADTNLSGDGAWSVELLDPEAADAWSNLTFEALADAPAKQLKNAWQIPSSDLAARRVNVLEFSDDARDVLMQRLAQGKVAFRLRGPEDGRVDDLFIWDTGYGQGFGTRPVLRVAFVPPPPTPGPPPGQAGRPTPLPLIVWIADPTPAATTTPVPGDVPRALAGTILFLSDRFGKAALMVYDPARGRVGQVTQAWPYTLAQQRDLAVAGTQVRVENKPCGGLTMRRAGVDVLVDPNDPARQCAQLVVPDRDSGTPREITQPGHMHYDPAVSPDGQWIAYVSDSTDNDEIFKIQPDGKHNTRLTENVWEWDKHPSWSPDGTQIVFWSNRDGRKQLYSMNADGSGARNISNNAYNDWDPVWVQ